VHTRICVFVALWVTFVAALAGVSATFGSDESAAPAHSRSATYRNPVIDSSFPDPDVVKGPRGWYYAYATQGKDRSRHVNIQVARSRDLVHWYLRGDALPRLPSWGDNAALSWGPQVVGHAGRYYLYYSITPNQGSSGSQLCLAVATSRGPAGPFLTTSQPLYCGTGDALGPDVFHDKATGQWRLYWGSGGSLFTAPLASSLTRLAAGAQPTLLLRRAVHQPYGSKIESPFVIARNGWYYLFYSGDHCCTKTPHYATMVARSRTATGPYQRLSAARPGISSVILHSTRRFAAPGSNSVIRDQAGHDWIVYHAVDTTHPRNPSGRSVRRVMMIDRIVYRNGWPTIAKSSPSNGLQAAPVTRRHRGRRIGGGYATAAGLPAASPGLRHSRRRSG
jgi:arabinan endo-1,5-alpha-L-arabinosidase